MNATAERTAVQAYESVLSHEAIRRDSHESVDLQPGDAYVQGDVIVARIDITPRRAGKWSEGRQLAQGTTQGSRHVAEGDAELFVPDSGETNAAIDRLFPRTKGLPRILGPCVESKSPWTMTHPEHGDRTFPAGVDIILYQRAASAELRRAQD